MTLGELSHAIFHEKHGGDVHHHDEKDTSENQTKHECPWAQTTLSQKIATIDLTPSVFKECFDTLEKTLPSTIITASKNSFVGLLPWSTGPPVFI